MRHSISRITPLRGAAILNKPWAFAAVLLVAILISLAIGYGDYRIGMALIAALVGGTAILVCLFNTKMGFLMTTIVGFFMFYIKRMSGDVIPTGVAVDAMITATFIGIYFQKTIHKQTIAEYMRHPVTYMFFIYIAFMLIELFNPSMHSIAGWLFTLRKYFNFVMIYFIGLHTFNSLDDVKDYFKLWIFLSVLAGAYGCFQQWFGLLGFEEHWVVSDPLLYRLYFQGGQIRKFSFLSDPTAYGIVMASSTVFCTVLAMASNKPAERRVLIAGIILMALGMAYSGTRTAYVMVPAGLSLYILMTITNRRTILFMAGFLVFAIILLFGPFSGNGTVNRIRTSFHMKDDASMNVRDENRASIQPYIHKHPLGGGLATSGVLGAQYNPGHPLAGFPPDSGYLRAALETGYIGLFVTMFIYFVALFNGVKGYYRSKTKEVRTLYVAMVGGLYSYVVAHYAQVAIGQVPGSLFFYSSLAIIVKLKDFEKLPQINSTPSKN